MPPAATSQNTAAVTSIAAIASSINAMNRRATMPDMRLTPADCRKVITAMRDITTAISRIITVWAESLENGKGLVTTLSWHARNAVTSDLTMVNTSISAAVFTLDTTIERARPNNRRQLVIAATGAAATAADRPRLTASTPNADHLIFASQLGVALYSLAAGCRNMTVRTSEALSAAGAPKSLTVMDTLDAAAAAARRAASKTDVITEILERACA